MSSLSRFFKFIVPPADGKSATPWRWAIFVCMIFLLFNAASGRGWMVGLGAYAAAQDVQIILELQYAETIRNLQRQICATGTASNATLENTLEDYQHRYAELTGRRYPLRPC